MKKLPGFGPYTVGAILSIAFDERYPIIDANVRRVVMRQLGLKGYAQISQDKKITKFLRKVMPFQNNRIFNQALMELGALVCLNRLPLCLACPVKTTCKAYKKGIQEIIPKQKKKIIKKIQVAVAVIKRKNDYFIQQRPPQGLFAGLWEFPGGKVERFETPQQALHREIQEELRVEVKSARYLFNVVHFYTAFKVTLHVFDCTLTHYPKQDQTHQWVHLNHLSRYPMPSGSAKILTRLLG